MVRNWQQRLGKLGILAIAIGVVTSNWSSKLLAQITPDATLGAESSVVNPDVIKGLTSDRISGGAVRGSNLFHSFQEFNIKEGRGAYFANPEAIKNIFSRVTGNNPSHLLGTLGVLGNANLFFLNPNGIIFGSNAQLDVRGSFVGSTANNIVFPDGTEFSATNPEAAPLLTVKVEQPIGLRFEGQEGLITNAADLVVGRNLTLAGGNLDLQGQLQAGGDLILQATDTVKVRDSLEQPFIASALGKLVLQGNQGIDIFALNHPESGFFSGGDMVLRSANAVGGDAHFWTDGSFRIEQLDGSLGNWLSFYDPIIRARGDVKFNSYQGASLHILAGGSVEIPGTITITQPDTTANSIQEQVTLSDGVTVLDIDGNAQPTLDIRAGIDFNTQRIANTEGFPPVPELKGTGTGTSADIAVSNILNRGGVVFLTNQYQPNPTLFGSITAGSIDTTAALGGGLVVIDARDGIKINGTVDVSGVASKVISGDGGDVTLLANGDIILNPDSLILSNGLLGGNIALQSNGEISITSSRVLNGSTTTVPGTTGGELNIVAESLSVTDGSRVGTITYGEAQAGNVIIQVSKIVLFDGDDGQFRSSGGSRVQPGAAGNGGNVKVETERLLVQNGAEISAATFGFGNSGNFTVQAQSVEVTGESVLSTQTRSSVQPNTEPATGNGGNLTIETERLLVTEGSQVIAGTLSKGNGGDLVVRANSVELIGSSDSFSSGLLSAVNPEATGNGGNLTIETERLLVENGAVISASTLGQGNAGNLTISAQSVELLGTSALGGVSGLGVQVGSQAIGDGGNLKMETEHLRVGDGAKISAAVLGSGKAGEVKIETGQLIVENGGIISVSTSGGTGGSIIIEAQNLELTKGGQLITSTSSSSEAGSITLKIQNDIFLAGAETGLFANTEKGSTGKSGNIFIDAEKAIMEDGARIAVDSLGTGVGGNIFGTASTLHLDNGSISAETASNTGGNIRLQVQDLLLLRNGSQISTTAGTAQAGGDGGNITIDTDFIVAFPSENSDITANAFTGNGGRIAITAKGLFGIEPRLQLTPLSDITASSQFGAAGIVEINTLEVEPNRGLTNLPEEAVEVEVAEGCQADDDQKTVAFFNQGRGGLPPSPNDPLRSETIIAPWIPLVSEKEKVSVQASSGESPAKRTGTLPRTPCRKN